MKNPKDVVSIVKGKVYFLPTFTNHYGEIIDGKALSLKFYSKDNSSANHGVSPVSLIKALVEFYKVKRDVNKEDLDNLGLLKKCLKNSKDGIN